jgi:hypothetical protein
MVVVSVFCVLRFLRRSQRWVYVTFAVIPGLAAILWAGVMVGGVGLLLAVTCLFLAFIGFGIPLIALFDLLDAVRGTNCRYILAGPEGVIFRLDHNKTYKYTWDDIEGFQCYSFSINTKFKNGVRMYLRTGNKEEFDLQPYWPSALRIVERLERMQGIARNFICAGSPRIDLSAAFNSPYLRAMRLLYVGARLAKVVIPLAMLGYIYFLSELSLDYWIRTPLILMGVAFIVLWILQGAAKAALVSDAPFDKAIAILQGNCSH